MAFRERRSGVVRVQDTNFRFFNVVRRHRRALFYGIKKCCPYGMPRKRPRLSPRACSVLPGSLATESTEQTSQGTTILELPTELLINIFKYFPYEVISKHLRAVHSRFRLAGCCALNSALLALGGRLQRTMAALELLLQSQDQAAELRTAAAAFNFLENLQCQHRLLLAVTGRLLDPASGRCLYDGALLDEMLHQLNLAVTDPARLVGQHCVHGVNERMRRFMDHFEKVLEMPTEPGWLPGAKALDVLDCALDVRRRVLKEAVELSPAGGRLLHLRLRYSMPRAYFVALPLGEEVSEASRAPQKGGAGGGSSSSSSSRDSREERRLVFLRLRRLVQHHNEYTLQKLHRDREEALCGRVSSMVLPTSFAGYGESGGRFFYYGNLNEGAYDFCAPLTGAPAEPVNAPPTYAFVVAGQGGGGGGQPAAQQALLPPPPPPPAPPPLPPPPTAPQPPLPAVGEDLDDDEEEEDHDYLLGPWAILMDEELAVDALAFEQPMQEEINIEEPRGNRENGRMYWCRRPALAGLRRAPGILQTPPLHVVTASPFVVLGAAPSPAGPSAAPSRPAPKPRDRDLQIQLELRCDLDLAPLAFLNKYQSDGEDAVEEDVVTGAPSTSKSRAGPSGGTRAWRRAQERVEDDAMPAPAPVPPVPAPPSCALRIAFHCPLAIENRLPGVAYLSCHSG